MPVSRALASPAQTRRPGRRPGVKSTESPPRAARSAMLRLPAPGPAGVDSEPESATSSVAVAERRGPDPPGPSESLPAPGLRRGPDSRTAALRLETARGRATSPAFANRALRLRPRIQAPARTRLILTPIMMPSVPGSYEQGLSRPGQLDGATQNL